jgi:hypothetical protein
MDKDDPHIKLVDALLEVRRKLDAGDDDWTFALLTTFREFCRALGFEPYLTDPILKMMMETQNEVLRSRRNNLGLKGRPPDNRSLTLTIAAAAVSVLSDSRRVDHLKVVAAVDAVARASGLEKNEIKHFRNNISRGKVAPDVPPIYRELLQKFKTWPKDDIVMAVNGLGILVT